MCLFNFNFSLPEKFFIFFGDLFLCLFLFLYLVSLFIQNWQKEIKNDYFSIFNFKFKIENLKKLNLVFKILIFVSFWILTESFAKHISYPLPRFLFNNEVFSIYGFIIGIGFLVAINNFEKYFYEKYDHGTIKFFYFFIVIPSILGAKFFYDFFLSQETFSITNFLSLGNFRKGGLSIFGGVIFGLIGILLYYLLFRPKILFRDLIDMAPNILIGQSIGRWGNFFNREIYGKNKFAFDSVWWLPTLIKKQMSCCGDSYDYVPLPLFLIESITNIVGYFVIKFVGKKFKKHLSKGDLCCLYFVWYSLTRIFLEPLRDDGFFEKNLIFAYVTFFGGLICIISLHIYDFFRWNKNTFFVSKNKFDDKNIYKNEQ